MVCEYSFELNDSPGTKIMFFKKFSLLKLFINIVINNANKLFLKSFEKLILLRVGDMLLKRICPQDCRTYVLINHLPHQLYGHVLQ